MMADSPLALAAYSDVIHLEALAEARDDLDELASEMGHENEVSRCITGSRGASPRQGFTLFPVRVGRMSARRTAGVLSLLRAG